MVVPYRSHASGHSNGKSVGVSPAQRDAEALFESQTVVEIREVCQQGQCLSASHHTTSTVPFPIWA